MGTVGTAVAIAGIAYLVGSIPAAYIVGRMVSGVDMRVAGEGNVGARNAYHVVGRGWGVAVWPIGAAEGGPAAPAVAVPAPLPLTLRGGAGFRGPRVAVLVGV